MKGLIFDIKRFAVQDGPGIRTTVFFKGCPLNCWWCHNPESRSINPETVISRHRLDQQDFETTEIVGKNMTIEEVMQIIDKEAVFFDESGGGVTLSGGEPMLQADFALALLNACKTKGYHTALDTCGYVNQHVLGRAAHLADLILYDLKHYDTEKHKRFTGHGNELILENLAFLIKLKKPVRVRIPVIPGINNGEEDMVSFSKLLKQMHFEGHVDLLPFHNMADKKYERLILENKFKGLKNMKKSDLLSEKKYFEEQGFKVKIGG